MRQEIRISTAKSRNLRADGRKFNRDGTLGGGPRRLPTRTVRRRLDHAATVASAPNAKPSSAQPVIPPIITLPRAEPARRRRPCRCRCNAGRRNKRRTGCPPGHCDIRWAVILPCGRLMAPGICEAANIVGERTSSRRNRPCQRLTTMRGHPNNRFRRRACGRSGGGGLRGAAGISATGLGMVIFLSGSELPWIMPDDTAMMEIGHT